MHILFDTNILICLCARRPSQKWKLIPKEAVRPGGLYTILTKGFEPLGVVYCGKVNI